MLTTIKGIYHHGKIILSEEPPVHSGSEVMVTFLPGEKEVNGKGQKKILLGLLEGKIDTPDHFDDPLDDHKQPEINLKSLL